MAFRRVWARLLTANFQKVFSINPSENSVGETPGSIPNPEVKPYSADDTAPFQVWKSRSSLGLIVNASPSLIILINFYAFE